MAHVFTSLLVADHDLFCKITQTLDPGLHTVGRSKNFLSLIPTKKQLVEESVIESLSKVKAVVISYDLWMNHKTRKFSCRQRTTAKV